MRNLKLCLTAMLGFFLIAGLGTVNAQNGQAVQLQTDPPARVDADKSKLPSQIISAELREAIKNAKTKEELMAIPEFQEYLAARKKVNAAALAEKYGMEVKQAQVTLSDGSAPPAQRLTNQQLQEIEDAKNAAKSE